MPAQMIDKGIPAPGSAGAGGGGKARRPPVAVSARRDLRPIGRTHRALKYGAVDRNLRGASQTTGRRLAGIHPGHAVVRADDAGIAAGAGAGQDQAGLRVGIPHDQLCGAPRGAFLISAPAVVVYTPSACSKTSTTRW